MSRRNDWLSQNSPTMCALLLVLLTWLVVEAWPVQKRSGGRSPAYLNIAWREPVITSYLQKERTQLDLLTGSKVYQDVAVRVRQERRAALLPPEKPVKPIFNCKVQHCIALTFDDGPSQHTTQLLDILQQRGAKATFFVLGLYAERYAPLVQRMVRDDHQIGNHTWHHRDLTSLSPPEIITEVEHTNTVIQQISGVRPHIMRPPFGSTSQIVGSTAAMPQVLWSVDPYDWRDRDARVVADRVVTATTRGDIILLHDVYQTSVEATPLILDTLRAKGFVFVTIDELISGGQSPAIGEYRRQP